LNNYEILATDGNVNVAGDLSTELSVNVGNTLNIAAGGADITGDVFLNTGRIREIGTANSSFTAAGALDILAAGSTIGDNADATQLTIDGAAGGADELVVDGDVGVAGDVSAASVTVANNVSNAEVLSATNTFVNASGQHSTAARFYSTGAGLGNNVALALAASGAAESNYELRADDGTFNLMGHINMEGLFNIADVPAISNNADLSITSAGGDFLRLNATGNGNTAIGNTGTVAITSSGLNVSAAGVISDGNSDLSINDNLGVTGNTTVEGEFKAGTTGDPFAAKTTLTAVAGGPEVFTITNANAHSGSVIIITPATSSGGVYLPITIDDQATDGQFDVRVENILIGETVELHYMIIN
jgi:hypothetical protein